MPRLPTALQKPRNNPLNAQPGTAHPLAIAAAFFIAYTVWGSTYLAIRIAVHDLPPGLLAGVRFILAGLILGAAALLRGQPWPRAAKDWRAASVMGVLLVVIGNGFVTWAEQWVPSNQAAVIIASGAFWTAWLGTFGPRGVPLSGQARLGLLIGFAGVLLMVWPEGKLDTGIFLGQVAIVIAPIAWAAGTAYARHQDLGVSPLMFAAMQMLAGGLMLTVAGLAAGETARWTWTPAGLGALAYLTLFGSCLAYGTYVWLIGQTTPARLGTIAYVNPVIATFLGWWILNETLTPAQLAGAGVIVLGVILVSLRS